MGTRKTLKILHTMGAIGFCGALASLAVMHANLPDPEALEAFATLRIAMGAVAKWILLPSMALVVVSGLLSMAATPAYMNAGWVWAKLLSGVIVFEGTLVYVQGPMERAARDARSALTGALEPTALGAPLQAEWGSFWVILAVGVFNVVVGIWRPRMARPSEEG